MSGVDRHAIGVCTFRRPGLIRTLETLEGQRAPAGRLTILIADNDDEPTAREQVEGFGRKSGHEIVYLHAPARNISLARNAILERARTLGVRFLAFIDDDEEASEGWYAALHAALTIAGADASLGPVRATYRPEAPEWMQQARSHDTWPEIGPNGHPIAGHSCNVLIDLRSSVFAGLRFDPARGATGGEDTAFFHIALCRGAILAFAAEAEVTELVPPHRARLNWLLRRRYRMGQTHGSLLAADGESSRVRQVALASAKVAWCAIAAFLTLPMTKRRNTALIRGALHAGVLSDAIGLRRMQPYGGSGGSTEERQSSS